ncbi:PQQ-binding-like beta-propeller repeat protein [Nonomuraea sp. NPDC050786]|uniref:outer membrane protein assembly factor BamB family protein n=1 Tax=Nonomuraea sp. NPDC050786 TaxID=3154840 RepID=UPI0033C3AD47
MSQGTVPCGDLARTGRCAGPGLVSEPQVVRRFTTPAGPSLPTVADGVMYVSDAEGNACAFDIDSGHRLWHQQHCDNPQDHDDWDFMRLEWPPALTPGLVIIDTGEETFGCERSDGQLRWKIEGAGRPTVVDDLLLRVGINGIEALDAASGRLRWQTSERSDNHTYGLLSVHPTIADGMVLVAEGFEPHRHEVSGVHAFDLRTGALRWEIWGDDESACPRLPPCDTPDALLFAHPPVWAHGLVWVVQGWLHADHPNEPKLVGLDPRTGRPERTLTLKGADDAYESPAGAPIFGPDLAYCRTDKRIDALDLATGTVQWTRYLDASMVGAPLLAGNILHLATENGGLQALDAGTGDLRWSIALDEAATWSADFPADAGEEIGYEEIATPLVLIDGSLFARTDNAVLLLC